MTTAKKTTRKKAAKKSPARKAEKKPAGFFRRLFFGMLWLLVIAAILYGAVLLLSRTAGFRSILAEKMAEKVGVPLHIGNSFVDCKLNLTLEDIVSEQPANVGNPQIEVIWLKLSWGLGDGFTPMIKGIEAEGCRVRLVQDAAGDWSPSFLTPLADKITRLGRLGAVNMMMKDKTGSQTTPGDEQAVAEKVSAGDKKQNLDVFKDMKVTIKDSSISWWRNGSEAASISGLNFMSRAVAFPGRKLQYYKVDAAQAQLGQSKRMNDISFEMLATKGRNIVLGPKMNWQKKIAKKVSSKKPVRSGIDNEMTDVERDILAEAEAVLSRNVVSATPMPTVVPVAEPVVVEEAPEILVEDFDIAAFDDLTDDESEALVEYIQEMLEMDPETMGSDYE